MSLSRREALRLALPIAAFPTAVLVSLSDAHAADEAEQSLTDLASANGWSAGAIVTSDAPGGGKAITWPVPVKETLATLQFTLGPLRDRVAGARRLRFRYRIEGATPATLHVKLIAYPLAEGYQAMYTLNVPKSGEWAEASLMVQDYTDVWGTAVPPQKEGGAFQIRIGKAEGEAMKLSVADIRVTPLPAGVAINRKVTSPERQFSGPKIDPIITTTVVSRLSDHPRLLLTAQEIPALKRRATEKGWGQAYIAGLKQRCDSHVAKAVDLPDRGSQWYHYYSCPKHGARLRKEGPHRHVCPIDGEVFSGYPYDDVVLADIHTDYSNQIRDLGLLYQVAGDKKYAAKAREILLAYADKYLTYPLHNIHGKPAIGGGRVGPQTLDEAVWLIPVAQGCDCIWDTLSDTDRETLRTRLFLPAAVDVIQKHRMGIHNIQCWKNSAMGLTALLFGDQALLADAVDNPDRGLQAQLARGITEDGPWEEGAWGYHFYTMSALLPLTEALFRAGIDVYHGPSGERYKKFYLAPIQMAMPDGKLPAFNDSGTATANGNTSYEIAYARWKDPELLVPLRISNRQNVAAFVNGFESLPSENEAPLKSQNFLDSGYAILRGGTGINGAYLALKYGPHGGGHGHPDKLNFVFYSGGRILADDPGTGNYGVPMHAGWEQTTVAHNTLVVDEVSQKPATGKCLSFRTGDGWSAALAEAGPIYAGVLFQRAAFLIENDTAVFLDFVMVSDGQRRTLDLAIHPSGAWVPPNTGDPVSMPNVPGYSYLRDMKSTHGPDPGTAAVFPVRTGDSSPNSILMIASSGPGGSFLPPPDLIYGTGIAHNTENRVPILLLRYKNAISAAAIWALSGGAPDAKLTALNAAPITTSDNTGIPSTDAQAVKVTIGGKTRLLIANPAKRSIKVGSYTGDDQIIVTTA